MKVAKEITIKAYNCLLILHISARPYIGLSSCRNNNELDYLSSKAYPNNNKARAFKCELNAAIIYNDNIVMIACVCK